MVLHGCMKCLKYVVFTFNFFVWVGGMAVLGFAIWMRMDPKVNHYVRASYDDDDINTYYIICYLLMGAGGVMTFVGFLGCCGAFQESRCMLGTFFIFLFLIFAAEVAGGVWGFIHRSKIEGQVTSTFTALLQNYYGTKSEPRIHEAIDYIQKNLQCCGGASPADWQQSAWVQEDITDPNKLPHSCCKEVETPKGRPPDNAVCEVRGEWVNGKHPGVWEKTCGEELQKWLEDNLLILVIVGLGIAAIQFMGMIFSLILCCAMRWSRGGGYKS